MKWFPRWVEISVLILASCLGLRASIAQAGRLSACEQPQVVRDPAAALVDAFRTHRVVLLGEVHRSAEMHAFMRALIASPEFGRVVDDIVVEATNVRYQSLLDRYIAGDSVPRDSLRLVWRNSTQLMLWDSPLYEELIETIRDANRKLPSRHKMRVLASDPPIDWRAVNTPSDFPKSFGYRDWQTTEVIEREVLARNHRALVIIGTAHIGRSSPRADSAPIPTERESVGEALARKHPGAAYVVHTVVGSVSPELETTVRDLAAANTLIPIAGTSLANKNSSLLFGKSITLFRNINGHRTAITLNADAMPPLGAVIDGILYLGPYSHEILPEASLYLDDPQYLAEIRRRIAILTKVYGGDFWSDELNAIIKRR
ncbi:MAG TPA: ChaN family lipoprotein [Gemmatimonadaceae bacterium]